MGTLFVTGFEPFRGKKTNLSWEMAKAFDGAVVAGLTARARRLPVSYARLVPAVRRIVKARPSLLLMLGECRSTDPLRWEQLAVNVRHARGRDNDGVRAEDRPVVPGGPLALRGTMPAGLHRLLGGGGDRAVPSFHAGTFCCNQAYYLALHQVAFEGAPTRVGFLHVPCVPTGRIPRALLEGRISRLRRCLEETFGSAEGTAE